MSNKSNKLWDGTQQAKQRRRRNAVRLEEQLRSGVKTVTVKPNGVAEQSVVPLTDKDVLRIKKELETIKKRI